MTFRKSAFPAGGNGESPTYATIAELYPDVERITLYVAVQEPDVETEPSYQQIIFTPESEASFELECSREECVAGGFDFGPVIDETVKGEESGTQGQLECQGTLGPIGPRCSLKTEYRIIVQ